MTDRPGSLSRRIKITLAVLVTVAWLLPVYWLVNVALKTQAQLMVAKPTFVFTPTFENFGTAVFQYGILWNALNSLIIAASPTAIALFFAMLFVYWITRFRVSGPKSDADVDPESQDAAADRDRHPLSTSSTPISA